MSMRIFAAVVAAAMFLAYLLPIVIKLKDGALIAVILIGVALMGRDLWESLKNGER